MLEHTGFIPIYKRLTDFYREKIIRQEMLPKSRIDSINKIMNRHGVSRETAKLVLKNLVNEGLAMAIPGKGTYVAPAAKLIKVWGIVTPFYSSNLDELIGCLHQEAKRRGRNLDYNFHYNTPETEINLVGSMIRKGYEAVIIVPNYDESVTADFYTNLNRWRTRVILVDNTMAGSHFDYVVQSYDLGIKRAYDYLGSGNTKSILLLKDESWRGKNLVYDLMEQTLRSLIDKDDKKRKLIVLSGAQDLNREIIDKHSIGGIISSTDNLSIRITARLLQWGYRIPEDVSVVSYGNTELTKFFKPSISSVDCHYDRIAYQTASLIMDSDTGNTRIQNVIQPDLIIRET